MSSDIANVSKLPPAIIVKADKPMEDNLTAVDSVTVLQPDSAVQASNLKPTLDVVKKAVDEGNSLLQSANRSLLFKVDESTQEMVVKIVDSETGKLIRQIPSEDMLAFAKRMMEQELQKGAVLQDRA